MKEATARIKINKLLEAAGWRFFPDGKLPANIQLEPKVTIKESDLNALGEDFEKTSKGYIDFLLLNEKRFPLIILEAKAEDKNPLVGKEQARTYARSQNCRFVILSNGNLHYFWDLDRGNPYIITSFPTPTSVIGYQKVTPDPKRLVDEPVGDDFIVLTQRPNYQADAAWKNASEQADYIQANTHAKLTALLADGVTPAIAEHGGRIVKNTGDGFLAEFPSAVEAVRAAVHFQTRVEELTTADATGARIAFRVGINVGDVIVEPHDIFGDGVNIAARLEGIAEPGGICISSSAYEQVRGKVPVDFTDLGEQALKNIARPIRAYAVGLSARGRRTQTSNGGNRGRCGEVARQTLWGFRGCRA